MNQNYIKKELIIGDFKYERYFTEFELKKENLLYVDFNFYIDAYYDKKIDKKHIYYQLFHVFYNIFKRFFQTPFKLSEDYRKFIEVLLTHYLFLRYMLINDKYEKDINILWANNPLINLKELKSINQERYLKLISALYHDLKFLSSKIKTKTIKREINIKNFDKSKPEFQKPEYSTINWLKKQVNKKLSQQIDFFIVHGSYATADFISDWSDLDTFIIPNSNIFNNLKELEYTRKELHKLSLMCYKINPLAHHTLIIFPDLVLEHYLETFLPIKALGCSIALKKTGNLNIQQIDDKIESFYTLWECLTRFRNRIINNKYANNLFEYETDLAYILFLPAIMMHVSGQPMYKKHAFQKIKQVFPEFNLSLINQASRERRKWKLFNWLRLYPNLFFNLLPLGLNNYLINKYRFYLMRFKKINNKLAVKNLTQDTLDFYERIFNYCLKKYKSHAKN